MVAYSHSLRRILADNSLLPPEGCSSNFVHSRDERAVYRALCPYGPGFATDATAQLEDLVYNCISRFHLRSRLSGTGYWSSIHTAVPFCAALEPSLIREFTLCLVNSVRCGAGRPGSPLAEALAVLSRLFADEAAVNGEEDEDEDEVDAVAEEVVIAAITREVNRELEIMRRETLEKKMWERRQAAAAAAVVLAHGDRACARGSPTGMISLPLRLCEFNMLERRAVTTKREDHTGEPTSRPDTTVPSCPARNTTPPSLSSREAGGVARAKYPAGRIFKKRTRRRGAWAAQLQKVIDAGDRVCDWD